MSPGGYARVMALTPPIGLRYGNERRSLTSTTKREQEQEQGPHTLEGPYNSPRCFASPWDLELAGIEPATSALQRRRSPS
jgi:hypothetical protein